MPRSYRLPGFLLLLLLWLAACYGVRYGLMEDSQWVGICVDEAARWQCQARSTLGLLIHFRVIAWTSLGLALVAFIVPRRFGRLLAALALFAGLPALVLYSANLAVFAVVLAGLRLVRSSDEPNQVAQG